MGCGSSSSKQIASSSDSTDSPSKGGITAGAWTGAPVDWSVIHSAVRWNRDPGQIRSMLASGAEVANLQDPKTGNFPIHIAAQNGHLDLVVMLLQFNATVNSQNSKGQTPMHMGVGYDYYEVVKALQAAGADGNLENQAGIPAHAGLDGDKSIGFAALVAAKTKEDADNAFAMLREVPGKINKADYVKLGLSKKKEIQGWPQESFKEILQKL